MYNLVVKTISGFIQTTRFIKSLGVGLLLSFFSSSIYYGMGALLFLLFSFAFNDWVDAPKDSIGHANRAIPSGKITRQQAFYISAGLLIVGVGWSTLFLGEHVLAFAVIYLFSIFYSFFLKPNIPILATPVWSSAIAILFIQPFTQDSLMYIAVASLVYSYELLLDYRDRQADREFCKTPTLANVLGKHTFMVSGLSFFIGIALLAQILI